MRWSIIRLIWLRELRDQLRDRRTVLMIVVLPLLLYPILGIGLLSVATGFLKQQSIIGIYNQDELPEFTPLSAGLAPRLHPVAAWSSLTPGQPGGGVVPVLVPLSLWQAGTAGLGEEYPPLVTFAEAARTGKFPASYFDQAEEADTILVKDLGPLHPADLSGQQGPGASYLDPLRNKEVDLILIIPHDFSGQMERGGRPVIRTLRADNEDRSLLATGRVNSVLTRWKNVCKEVRLLKNGLPANFDDVIGIQEPDHGKSQATKASDSLFDLMGRIFPFLLVMWSLAGALYPAVDLCAGEKERGTMETLLISPVSREEIVYAKFLAIWVFSAATALLNLLSMGITTWKFVSQLPTEVLRPGPLLWCVVVVLPLSAFFSAICLAIGAYARSSKEGQYYLMPLFLLTMPLIFLTLIPSVKLNPVYCLVPVTGVALLLQNLMTSPGAPMVWVYFLPVLAPMMLYGWLALRWAVMQFQREEVLFREAERLDLALWLRRLFRDKEETPSTGQGLFCFVLILLLRWLTLGFGDGLPLMVRTGIEYLAFVLVPPVLMALLLTTRPAAGLGLRLPAPRAVMLAMLLAVFLLPPLAGLTYYIYQQFPGVQTLLKEGNPLTRELEGLTDRQNMFAAWLQYLLVLGVLAPVCEELAFRGFLLGALRRRFRTWTAILLSSFLFALYHANVFQLLPAFLLGVVLALLAVRSGSIVPGILFHLCHNSLLIGSFWLARGGLGTNDDLPWPVMVMVIGLCTMLSAGLLWRVGALRQPPLAGGIVPAPPPVMESSPNGSGPRATVADELVPGPAGPSPVPPA